MTVNELLLKGDFTPVCLPNGQAEISSCYAGDLLSWVMGRAETDCAWVTIMTNSNVVAVASLIEMACVIFAENTEPEPGLTELAQEKGVNLLRSSMPTYETCVVLSKLL